MHRLRLHVQAIERRLLHPSRRLGRHLQLYSVRAMATSTYEMQQDAKQQQVAPVSAAGGDAPAAPSGGVLINVHPEQYEQQLEHKLVHLRDMFSSLQVRAAFPCHPRRTRWHG